MLFAVQIQNLALAAPRTALNITADNANVFPGSVFTVTVSFTSKDEDISVVQASIEYDDDILEYRFAGNAVELSGGTGGISDNISSGTRTVSYDIQFTAIKPGKAKISVNQSQLIGHDTGTILGEPVSDIIIVVSEPASKPGSDVNEKPDETPPGDEQPSDSDWLEITLDGKTMHIVRDLNEVTLPQGFGLDNAMYGEEEIQVARDPKRDLNLIYIRDRGFSSFYVYDEQGSIYPFINMDYKQQYTILKTQEKLSDCVETTMTIDGKPVPAWTSEIYGDDFYIVYAVNSIGNKGFYLYDTKEGTMQRLIAENNNANTIDEEN